MTLCRYFELGFTFHPVLQEIFTRVWVHVCYLLCFPQIDVRVSPYFFNRTCGMCGDCNAEWYRDLKTPMGKEYTSRDRLKYGNVWMVPEETCLTGMFRNK